MKVRRLDQNHDWSFGSGICNYAQESEAIAQTVKCKLLSITNDWFLDFQHGINWPKYLRKNPNFRAMELEIKQAVLKTSGVTEITDFDMQFDVDTRRCIVTVEYADKYNKQIKVSADVTGNR